MSEIEAAPATPAGSGGVPYREVRSLERGLALLDAMAALGWSTPASLARQTGIARPSIYRLLNTLASADYVVRRPDGRYFLAPKLRRMGFEIPQSDLELQIAQEELDGLTEQIAWPSDYAALVAGQLTILASTHRLTTMTFFRRLIGQHRPLLRSALGRALLAAMSADELDRALEAVRAAGGADSDEIEDGEGLRRTLETTRAQGFASSSGLIEPTTSAIAVAVRHKEQVVGAINVVFFRSAMSPAAAAAKFLAPLQACATRIERRLAAQL